MKRTMFVLCIIAVALAIYNSMALVEQKSKALLFLTCLTAAWPMKNLYYLLLEHGQLFKKPVYGIIAAAGLCPAYISILAFLNLDFKVGLWCAATATIMIVCGGYEVFHSEPEATK